MIGEELCEAHSYNSDYPQQIQISLRVQRQIAFEFGDSLPDICQSIDSINTTLPYLITLKVAPDQRLHTFMTETLRMRDTEGLHSRKVSCLAIQTYSQQIKDIHNS